MSLSSSHITSMQMEKANKRIQVIKYDLQKLDKLKKELEDSDDEDDDDLDDREGLEAELKQLEEQNRKRQEKLDEYEKNKKWNVDNLCQVKEDATIVNPAGANLSYTPSGFVVPKEELLKKAEPKKATETKAAPKASTTTSKPAPAPADTKKKATAADAKPAAKKETVVAAPAKGPERESVELGTMETYHQFTEKYADTVELFMKIPDMAGSKDFLLKNADILLQENASNYLLLASLEDEMNGYRDKMKRTARQSQIISNIAELAKTLNTHPGNVIEPFFARMQQREHFEEFMLGVNAFIDKIIQRAVVKKKEMDEARRAEMEEAEGSRDLHDIPREERLGPGGLDPLEVIETLPEDMVRAFESRDVEQLKQALMKLSNEDAEYHMQRCVASGLWTVNG